MSAVITNIKMGSGTATPMFSQCDSITYVDSAGVLHDIASAWYTSGTTDTLEYASGTTGAFEFWAKSAPATWKPKNPWSDEYGSSGTGFGIVFLLYQPTTTHSWKSVRGITDSSSIYNASCDIVELTDNGDGTFVMSKFIYGTNSADVISVGTSVSGSAEYYLSNTYSSANALASWDGKFNSGVSYAIMVNGRYMSYNILTGSHPALVGASGQYCDWQLSQHTLVTLKKSATGIYGDIII